MISRAEATATSPTECNEGQPRRSHSAPEGTRRRTPARGMLAEARMPIAKEVVENAGGHVIEWNS